MKYILQIVLYVSMIGCAQKPVIEHKTETIDNQKPLIINAVKYDEFIKKVDELTKYLNEIGEKISTEQIKYNEYKNKSERELIEFIVKNNLHKVYIDAKEYRDFYCERYKSGLKNDKVYCSNTYD